MTMLNRIRRKKFGEILVGDGLVTKEQLQEALAIQKNSGDFLGAILLEMGHITETDIIKTLSVQYGLPFMKPSLYDLDRKLIGKFKPEFLHLHKLLPIDQIGNLLLVVVTDIPGEEVLSEIQEISGTNLAIYIASMSEVDLVLKEHAPVGEEIEDLIRRRRKGEVVTSPPRMEEASDGEEPDEDSAADPDEEPAKKQPVFEMDSSWESIFDQADGKVKGDEAEA
jgi:hypothetical protein